MDGGLKVEDVNYLVFVMVDDEGNITELLTGANVIPGKEYDFFFVRPKSEAELLNLNDYKVVMKGFKADLVLKSTQ